MSAYHKLIRGCGVLGLCVGMTHLAAGDWPSFRGPTGDGVCTERMSVSWPSQGPRLVWRVPLLGGFSSFTIAGGRAFTLVRRTVSGVDSEVLVALDIRNGAQLWSATLGAAAYESGGDSGASGNSGGDGPRSTPVVDAGRVYVLSSLLSLACFDAVTGQRVWGHDLTTGYGGSVIPWQNGASPLVEGEFVIVNGNGTGQRLLAFRKATGGLAWKGLDERLTHSTPVAVTFLGVRQVVFATQSGLLSVNPLTGAQLWRSSLSFSVSTGISPVVAGDTVYLSAAYNVGAMAVKVTRSGGTFSAARIWRKSGDLMNHWMTPVHHEGHVYGMYGYSEFGSAPLKCVELATGVEKWSVDGFGHGGLIVVDGKLVVLSDAGDVVVVEPDPAVYREVRRFRAVTGKCWSTPAISDGRLYVRSTKEGACYDVSLPRLQWRPMVAVAGGMRLELGTADGSALDSARVERLQVRVGSDPGAPLSAWDSVATPGVLTNGLMRFHLPYDVQAGARFFIALDP